MMWGSCGCMLRLLIWCNVGSCSRVFGVIGVAMVVCLIQKVSGVIGVGVFVCLMKASGVMGVGVFVC